MEAPITTMTTPTPTTEPAFAAQHHDEDKPDETEPDVHFEPVVKLEPVEVKTLEEDETPIFKMRGKLFRFDRTATEWKERGVGNVRLMMHNVSGKVRLLMRRDKTLKICANHYLTETMKLQPNVDSDRSWVWNAVGDFSDGESKNEMLAIRFANAEFAQRFKSRFDECKQWNIDLNSGAKKPDDSSKPQPDPDAIEVAPEMGSEKRKKDEEEKASKEEASKQASSSFTTTTTTDQQPLQPSSTSKIATTEEVPQKMESSQPAVSTSSSTSDSSATTTNESTAKLAEPAAPSSVEPTPAPSSSS